MTRTSDNAPLEVFIPPPPPESPPRTFAGYQEAIAWLERRTNVEKAKPARLDPTIFKLDRMVALMHALGNPHRDFKSVHIAGSKGKGSTVEMVAAALMGCGYTVGVYTSPHLVHVRERVRIGKDCIAYAPFAAAMSRVATAAATVEPTHGPLTYFEVITALAFVYFAEQAVDIAIVETGLGGRLDSTNVITPEVAAITAIQLEHTELLGSTIEQIAREKAGIFKPGIPAVTIRQPQSVHDVFDDVARVVGTEVRVLGRDLTFTSRFEADPKGGPHARVSLTTPQSSFEHVAVPFKGEHQAVNCGLALAILDVLRQRGMEIVDLRVIDGLAEANTAGRMELAWRDPRVLLDGAHNPESIACLVKAIGAHLRYDSLVVVFGCCADKDVDGMLSRLSMGADKVIFTRAAGNARAANPEDLQRRFTEISGKSAQVTPDLPAALTLASQAVAKDDLICVTGSFYLVGEAKKYLQDKTGSRAGKRR